jgi:hypothetical protein
MDEAGKDKEENAQQGRIRTVYSNIVRIGHSPYEFMLDFGQFQPEGKRAFMDVRIISSPPHAKVLLKALKENLTKYEEKYGKIGSDDGGTEEDIDTSWGDRRRRS